MKKSVRLPIFSEKYLSIFEDYKASIIEQQPNTEYELLQLYGQYTYPIVDFTKELLQSNITVLYNEIRAMLGHLSEYRLSNGVDRNELQKAYGHFRRLNIDTFKIICDEFDKAIFRWLSKYAHYDYRDIKNDFLKTFVEKYIEANKSYLLAQKQEKVGSDYKKHEIITQYYSAAKLYIETWKHLAKYKNQCAKLKRKKRACLIASATVTIAGIIWSTIEIVRALV